MKLVLCLAVVLSAGGTRAVAGPPAVAPPPRPVKAVDASPAREPITSFAGEVTAVDGRSVTVRGFDFGFEVRGRTVWSNDHGTEHIDIGNPLVVVVSGRRIVCDRVHQTRTLLTLDLPNGEVMPIRRADQPAVRFPVDEVLAGGRFDPDQSPGSTYRLSDVRVGDDVVLSCRPDGGRDVCRAVAITRRPGGRVPPAPGEAPDARRPHHAWVNALQDYEEHGTPIPEALDFLTTFRAAQAERQNLRQLEAMQATRARTAPPPRPAKPKPPTP